MQVLEKAQKPGGSQRAPGGRVCRCLGDITKGRTRHAAASIAPRCERRPECQCCLQQKQQMKIKLWTEKVSRCRQDLSGGRSCFSKVILSANICRCLSSPAIQLCFTAGKHGTVCLPGFVAGGWGGVFAWGRGEEEEG